MKCSIANSTNKRLVGMRLCLSGSIAAASMLVYPVDARRTSDIPSYFQDIQDQLCLTRGPHAAQFRF